MSVLTWNIIMLGAMLGPFGALGCFMNLMCSRLSINVNLVIFEVSQSTLTMVFIW